MRPELERLRLIEQQLLNGPAALPAEDWRLRQLLDGELAADAAAQQQLYHGLRRAGRRQLGQELRQIHARLYGSWWARLRRCWPL
ncbi:hypothetical protein [Hymenobacter rubidus]|uniref:hypothetical protein n=1 Tax=Hymenobacter rubidus TaxID=1441626 RepID=UPI00191D2187|nr:hypothetical protein [Hymenobacter rubidus]